MRNDPGGQAGVVACPFYDVADLLTEESHHGCDRRRDRRKRLYRSGKPFEGRLVGRRSLLGKIKHAAQKKRLQLDEEHDRENDQIDRSDGRQPRAKLGTEVENGSRKRPHEECRKAGKRRHQRETEGIDQDQVANIGAGYIGTSERRTRRIERDRQRGEEQHGGEHERRVRDQPARHNGEAGEDVPAAARNEIVRIVA